jgi:predicted acetyltransferase
MQFLRFSAAPALGIAARSEALHLSGFGQHAAVEASFSTRSPGAMQSMENEQEQKRQKTARKPLMILIIVDLCHFISNFRNFRNEAYMIMCVLTDRQGKFQKPQLHSFDPMHTQSFTFGV